VGTEFQHLFTLDYIKTWLRSHRCASDTQIRTASQKYTVNQESSVEILTWCTLPFYLVWERRSLLLALHPGWGASSCNALATVFWNLRQTLAPGLP